MLADKIAAMLSLSVRETWAVRQMLAILSRPQLSPVKAIAAFMALVELFGMLFFGNATTPRGGELNLAGYSLVFSDEFNGDSLNTEVWHYRGDGVRRNGFMAPSQVEVKGGNCIITGEYLTDGKHGEGWYGGMISLLQKYECGYFECRCICNNSPDFWSAFWIQADSPYTPSISRGGIGGAELDIFESMSYNDSGANRSSVTHTIHCAGMEGDTSGGLNSCNLGRFKGNNIYTEYNTYGLEWTQDEYIFYINGVETTRSSFADGVSRVPETVILSLELPEEIGLDKTQRTQFIVDYVKIWQK